MIQSSQNKVASSFYQQKLIIPPIEKKLFSEHYNQTSSINSASLKRNLLFTSTKQKSLSQEKLQNQQLKKTYKVKLASQQRSRKSVQQPKKTNKEKFTIIDRNQVSKLNWEKWKQPSINLTGKKFLNNLKDKAKTDVKISSEMKQNVQLFKLRHKIRELTNLKQTLKMTKQNNLLINRLESQSNQKIRDFFSKYQQIIDDVIR